MKLTTETIDNNEVRMKVRYGKGMYVYAEVKKETILHKLGWAKKTLKLVEDKDYVIVATKPFSLVIITNANPKFEYYVDCQDMIFDILNFINK